MKISADELHFDSLAGLKGFVLNYELLGLIQFGTAIKDNSGKILIKEKIFVKDTFLKRLEEMEGQFVPEFHVLITNDLLKQIKLNLTKSIIKRLDAPENAFINSMYTGLHHNFRAYIRHSFVNRILVLAAFKVSMERPFFFNHVADIGLLTMGIVMQKVIRLRNINRYSFLAGFCADLALADNENLWKNYPDNDVAKNKLAIENANFATRFNLPDEVIESISNHPYNESMVFETRPSLGIEEVTEAETGEPSIYTDVLESNTEEDETFPPGKDEKATLIITEALRIARFIKTTASRVIEPDHFAEELVYKVAYNSARGYFHKDLINPIVSRFKQYEAEARKLMRIAEIERMCLYPPSAWAYPKPRSAQILCKNRVMHCPKLVSGWDMHVISRMDAFGWLGASLDEGNYSKCALESELEKN